MLKVLLVIFFSLPYTFSIAQMKVLKGKALSQDGMAVPYAVVTILNQEADQRVIAAKIASENGIFIFDIDSLKGNYIIQISHASFDTLTQKIDFKDTMAIRTQLFYLTKKTKQLADIIVIGEKPLITRKMDKVIMNVEDNALTAGQNTFSLLQMAPDVTIMNYNIAIGGVWGARIYINGRPLQLSGAALRNYLNGLRASDIQSIEIIAHPSAEYDAEGAGGIINIILKKSKLIGWDGYVGYDHSFALGGFPTYNPYTSLNFNNNKLQLSVKYNYSNQYDYLTITQERAIINGTQSTATERIANYVNSNFFFTGDYNISKRQNVGIYYNGTFSNDTESMFSQTKMIYSVPTNNINSNGDFPNRSNIEYHNFGFNYEWITDTLNSKFLIASDYTHNKNNSLSEINSKTYNNENNIVNDTLYNYIFPSISNIYTMEARYNKVYRNGTELDIGGKFSSTDINTDNSFNIFQGNAWINDPEMAFNYHYQEKISAAFIQLGRKLLSVNYRIGLRGENSDVNSALISQNEDSINSQKYFDIFPTIFIGGSIDKKGNDYISLSYNRRISRPPFSYLNPYKYFVDNYSVVSGNPFLKPSFSDIIELGYTLDHKYYIGFTYSHMKDQINQVIQTDPTDTIVNLIRENIGNTNNYTINVTAPIHIEKWWETNNTLILQYKRVTASEFNIEKGTFTFQTNHELTFSPTTSFNLFCFYTPRTIFGNTVTGQYSDVALGLKEKLFKNKLILGIHINDLFYRVNPHMVSYYNNSEIYIFRKFQTRLLTLSIVYNFSVGKSFKIKKLERSNEDENNRLK